MENINVQMPFLKVKKVREDAIIPSKREEDGCYDLFGCFDSKIVFLFPKSILKLSIGFSTSFPKNWIFKVFERGSTGILGIASRAGIIDSGYRGEIFIILNNTSEKLIVFSNYHKDYILDKFKDELGNFKDNFLVYSQKKAVAQAGLIFCPDLKIEEVDKLDDDSLRGDNCLGSTNEK